MGGILWVAYLVQCQVGGDDQRLLAAVSAVYDVVDLLQCIYNIVDSRYRSRKPLIVTTNLTLDEIRHPQDTVHARIYDRLLEMCIPISCTGVSFRKETAQEKRERMKLLIG